MSETKPRDPGHVDAPAAPRRGAPFPLGPARKGLTGLGIAFVAVNLVLMMSGSAGSSGSTLATALWGTAALCFLGAFVVYMVEPTNRRDDKAAPSRPATTGAGADTRTENTATVKEASPETAPGEDQPNGAALQGAGAKKGGTP